MRTRSFAPKHEARSFDSPRVGSMLESCPTETVPLLSLEDFQATFTGPMHQRPGSAAPPLNVWPYVDTIPAEDFFGRRCLRRVRHTYRDTHAHFEHVVLDTNERNVFMVIVVDLRSMTVVGHRLLDLNAEYGLIEQPN
jgi:hypothetical protein